MINFEDLNVLKDKIIYATSDDKYVVYEDKEEIVNSVDYKLLGFQNNYSYANSGGYLVKSTLNGDEIAKILLDVDYGVFKENFEYMYFFNERYLYKVTERMEIEWELTFDDYIRNIIVDNYGSIYILFKNSRTIRKYSKDKEYIYFLDQSDDPTRYCRLYTGWVSEGSGHLYVIGSEFYDNKCRSFIDHYDTRKCKLLNREILCEFDNVKKDDEYFTYKDLYVDGDFIYIYANNYVEKINLKMRPIWKYGFGYNYSSSNCDYLNQIVFDDKKFKDRIYFCENFDTTNGYSFGKLSTNGDLMWKLTNPQNITKAEFNVCVYKEQMYVVCKKDVELKKSFVLSLDNNRVLFEVRDGSLVRVVQDNYDEIFSPDSYYGKYLLGDELKKGVLKRLPYILLHDYGEIIADPDNYLLAEEENKNIRDPENYNYFKLVGSEDLGMDANEISRLAALNGSRIITLNGSYINTLYPYQPEKTNQYIVTPDNRFIDTDDDKHLIRSKAMYTDWFYLIADEFKYHQDIITKKEYLTILTKKKHFSIRKKKRSIYRYVIKRLIDIDIIVEHLEQNGVLDTLVPKYVDKLRHHTTHMIEDMQKALSPTYFDLGAIKRYSYNYDGYEYPLRISATQVFMCKNIPYIKKRYSKSIFMDRLDTLISNGEITPFMLFLNGKAIKWSDITVIRDWYFSYLIIANNTDESERLESVMFPCNIRYGEDNNIIPDNDKHMYFTKDGILTEKVDEIAIRIEVTDKDVIGNSGYLNSSSIIEVPTAKYDQLSASNNIFIFEDNKFFGDSRFYLDAKGKNKFVYIRDTNPLCKTFYFDKANDSKNMLYDIPNQEEVEANIVDKIDNPKYIPSDNFMVPFDFKLSRDKSYLRNISEATRYILTYNMSLLADYYKDQSNIKSFVYTGRRIQTLSANYGGYLHMPRQMGNGCFDFIIVFKNDELYDYYHEIEYKDKEFIIPIFSHVDENDKIEILHFKNVNNSYSSLIVSTTDDYISEDLRYNDFLLFGNSPSGKGTYDKFDVESNMQYDISFDYKNNFDGNKYQSTTISLKDPYYIGKSINIASKHQFHYMYYNILREGQTIFGLEPEFRFCHNKNQFMIFVNNKKLNFSDWSLEIVNNKKDFLTIKTLTPLNKGDRIHIFYIPETYEEIILNNHLSQFGDIIVDTSNLGYSFDKDLFMIFVDGKKINNEDIQNISMNRVRIKTDYPEYSNICICKYLKSDELLEKVFSYGDKWSNAVSSLSVDQYNKLFIKSGVVK